MSINTFILSKGNELPGKMAQLLDEASFFRVKGRFNSYSRALSGLATSTEKIDYLFLDLENNASDLPHLTPDILQPLRLVLFSDHNVFMLDRAKDNIISSLINFEIQRGSEPLTDCALESSAPFSSLLPLAKEEPSPNEDNWKHSTSQNSLFVKSNNKIVRISLDELCYVESQKDYLHFHTREEDIKVLARMKHLAPRLSQNGFIRIHRSYLVRVECIHTIEGELIYLQGHSKPLPIGPSYKSTLISALALV